MVNKGEICHCQMRGIEKKHDCNKTEERNQTSEGRPQGVEDD